MKIKRIFSIKLNWRIVVLAIFSVAIYLIASNGYVNFNQPTLFDDEFGYWLGSAYLMGDDWSEVAKYTAYYSYGYGFLIGAPLRLFFSQAFVYNAAIQVNALLLVVSFLIACYMSGKLIPQIKDYYRFVFCFVLCIYPSYIVFSHMTLAECLLIFLFWVFVWLSHRVMAKPTYLNHAALGLLIVMLYAVHQRTFAVIIATILVLFVLYTVEWEKRLYLVCFYGVFVLAFLGHCYIKADLLQRYHGVNPGSNKTIYVLLIVGAIYLGLLYLPKKIIQKLIPIAFVLVCIGLFWLGTRFLYSNNAVALTHVTNNNLAGQTGKIKYILSKQGAWTFLFSLTSKALYLMLSTCLLIYWGIEKCLREMIRLVIDICKDIKGKLKYSIDHKQLWYSWLLLIFLGSFAIMAIFMVIFTRVDCLLYGRYVEHIIGIYVMLGMGHLLQDKKWWIKLIVMGAATLLFGYIASELVQKSGIHNYSPYHVVYMDYWIQKYGDHAGAILAFSREGLVIGAAVTCILKMATKNRIHELKIILLTAAITVGFVYSGKQVIDNNILRYQYTRNKNYRPIVWEIEKYNDNLNYKVYYCKNTEQLFWSQLFQFFLGHEPLHMIDTDEIVPKEEAFYVMGITQTDREGFYDKYYPIKTTEKYVLCTNRGTELEAMIRAKKGE